MVLDLLLGPDLFHCGDLLAHLFHARGELGTVILDVLDVSAAADAEQKPLAGDLVDRGDELCHLDRVALNDEADAGCQLELVTAAAVVNVTKGSMTS